MADGKNSKKADPIRQADKNNICQAPTRKIEKGVSALEFFSSSPSRDVLLHDPCNGNTAENNGAIKEKKRVHEDYPVTVRTIHRRRTENSLDKNKTNVVVHSPTKIDLCRTPTPYNTDKVFGDLERLQASSSLGVPLSKPRDYNDDQCNINDSANGPSASSISDKYAQLYAMKERECKKSFLSLHQKLRGFENQLTLAHNLRNNTLAENKDLKKQLEEQKKVNAALLKKLEQVQKADFRGAPK